jgi:hypothetical protein
MPYKFGEYVSQYVDPKSIEIGETLHNRYMEAFKTNDQLAMAVDQMQAALPFENDMMKKKELQAQLDEKLAQIANRGDFENLGFVIHKEAKDFSRKYAPIKENYTRYATAMTELQESIKKGDVNEEYQNLFPSYMVKGYKGFEMDEATGRVKQGTMFSAPTAVKDPKIMEKLQARLAILKPETFKSKITGYTGEGNMYKFTTEDEVIKIDKADVQDVIDAVLSEPDVKAYVDQFADMKAYAATKTEGASATVASMADNYSKVVTDLTAKLDDPSLKSGERAQIKGQLEVLTAEIAKATKVAADEKLSYEYVKNKYEDEIISPYQSYGEKAIMQSETHNRSKEFSETYLKDQEWQLANQGLMVQGKISLADRNGATLEEKSTNLKNAWATAYNLEKQLNDPNFVSTLSEESLIELKGQLKSTKDQALLIQQQMFTAANSSITEKELKDKDPSLYSAMKALYPWAKPGEIYIRMQETFSDEGGQDYANLKNKFKEVNGGDLDNHVSVYYRTDGVTARGYGAPGAGGMGGGAFLSKDVRDKMYSGYGTGDGTAAKVVNKYNESFRDKINSQFKEIKTSNTFNYGAIDAPTLQESKNLTAAMQNFFIGKPITADFNVVDISENGATDVKGSELAGFKVVDVGWNRVHNIYELKLMGGKDDAPISKTVHLDGKYLRNSTLDNLLNTPENRMAGVIAEMDMHQAGAVSSRPVKILGMDAHMVIESDGAGKPYIRYVDNNWQNFTGDAAVLSQKHRQDSNALRSIVNAYNKQSESYAVEF